MTTILFLHGWRSVPGGVKPTYLKAHGHTVVNPALDDDDLDVAVATAQAAFDQNQPQLVVGSSRGGAIAMNMNSGNAKLVLLCPAWKKRGAATVKAGTVILHSRSDDVVAFKDSEELVRNSRLPASALIEVGIDHRLSDEQSLSVLLWICNMLSSGETISWLEEDPSLPVEGGGTSSDDGSTTQMEGSYVCDACGEEIVIPLDLAEGGFQTYVEDCPVCCRANTIHVEIDVDGNTTVWATPEQDYE